MTTVRSLDPAEIEALRADMAGAGQAMREELARRDQDRAATNPPEEGLPPAWIEAMAEGEADLAAGRVFELADVLAEFEREDEAELANAAARAKPRRRIAEA